MPEPGSLLFPALRPETVFLGLFLLVSWLLLRQLAQDRRILARKARSRGILIPVLVGLGVAILAGTAGYWSFAGHLNPGLSRFQQLYDRRPEVQARKHVRGRLLDRNGKVLAGDAADGARRYPLGPAAAGLVGYHSAVFGDAGLEAVMDRELTGRIDWTTAEWRRVAGALFHREVLAGEDATTTLDAGLQTFAFDLLEGKRGAIVLTESASGRILAAVTSPSYDPARIDRGLFERLGKDQDAPLLNRPFQGRYPPGSVFKVVAAAAALARKDRWSFDCPAEGFSPTGRGWYVRDHEYYEAQRRGGVWEGHGWLELPEALVQSSNVFFAQLGVMLGMDALYEAASRFGFNLNYSCFGDPGRPKSLEVYRSPFPPEMGHNASDTARVAIGQSKVEVTPLHVALILGAVANGGNFLAPRLLMSDPPLSLAKPVEPLLAARLRSMLREVCTRGTGAAADGEGLETAGKTGTAENSQGKDHAWFAGFAPASKPRLAVVVLVENAGYGGTVAAPLAAKVLTKARELGYLAAKP